MLPKKQRKQAPLSLHPAVPASAAATKASALLLPPLLLHCCLLLRPQPQAYAPNPLLLYLLPVTGSLQLLLYASWVAAALLLEQVVLLFAVDQ